MTENLPELLTVNEVAAVLRCCPGHVRNMIRKGALESVRPSPRCTRVKKQSVLSMIESATQQR